jgi:hypothetical protein
MKPCYQLISQAIHDVIRGHADGFGFVGLSAHACESGSQEWCKFGPDTVILG